MDVVILLVLISLALVTAGLIFFIYRLREGDFDHGERLALSPLSDDDVIEAPVASASTHQKQSKENPEGGTLHVGS